MTPCGPACMAVAFRLLDMPVRNHELDRLSDPKGVSNLYDLCQYARSKGIHADVAALSPRALVELDQVAVLNLRLPDATPGGDALQHFVVFAGTDPSGRWHVVDPVGAPSFTGLVEPEALVRSWTGRALILSREPLPWPLERGWWLRRWSVGALWWIVAPLACMAAVYTLLSYAGRRSGRVRGTRRPSDTGPVRDLDDRVA